MKYFQSVMIFGGKKSFITVNGFFSINFLPIDIFCYRNACRICRKCCRIIKLNL